MKLLMLFIAITFSIFTIQAQTSGCCTITKTAIGSPVDRNDSWTDPAPITFITGPNAGVGQCNIPAGAIITSCTVTLSGAAITAGTIPWSTTHAQVTVFSGAAGATNTLSVIGAGLAIDFNALSGTPVNGTTVGITLAGTALCGNSHSHTAQVTVSVQLCWTLTAGTFYQGTSGLQSTYLSHCMENLDCAATLPYVFADDGTQASGGFYSNGITSYYRTFCPNTAGQCVSATVNYMSVENTWDDLYVLNGPTQNSTTLWRGNGTIAAPATEAGSWSNPFVANNESGCLSFRFYSDGTVSYGGWYITLSCVPCAIANQDTSSDCPQSIPTCGSTSFSGSSTGPGLSSTCSGCVVAENFSTWYFFEIASNGTLSLTIDPTTDANDYDFALFQASDCNSLGAPVRCSYAANVGNTGLGNGAVDNSEDVAGDGWVAPLNVTAGQTYILMVNGWSPTDNGYNLDFTLGGGATFDDCSNISLPVELVEFRAACDKGNTELFWTTASEQNADYFAVMKSTDNTVYKTIGYVMAAGNSNTLRQYYFKDPEMNEGSVYYKLKTVDFDGSFEFSELVQASCGITDPNPDITIADNQEFGYTSISFSTMENLEYQINMVDMSGRLVFSESTVASSQIVTLNIPTADLKAGVYSLSVRANGINSIKKLVLY